MTEYNNKGYSLGPNSYVDRLSTGYKLIQGNAEPESEQLFMFRSIDELLMCERDNLDYLLGELEK